jgi:adenylate cyclase
MTSLSPDEVADRAGVPPEYVDRLVGLGILEPDETGNLSSTDVQRARIMQLLERSGLPLEGLGEGLRRGVLTTDFMNADTYDRWAALTDTTFEELSASTGVPVDLLTVIREALGYVPPEPGDRMREDEMDVVPLVQLQYEHGFRPAVIGRALRVFGESMRRVAETESDWWRSEVIVPILEAGKGPQELDRVALELSPPMAAASDRALLAIYHGQQANAWVRNILEGLESALTGAGLYEAPERVPAICFLDLTGYTRLTEERGDAVAADLARELSTLVQRRSVLHGGRAVKWLGDGVMFHFPEPERGVLAALDMVETAAQRGMPAAHVGLHAGPVLYQEGDYFGRTVNIAARIADLARPGEVLVSEDVVRASSGDRLTFEEIGPVELKGVSGTLLLFRARRSGTDGSAPAFPA